MTEQDTNQADVTRWDAEGFQRKGLTPEGRYRFTLEGNYGLMETQNGKPYIKAMFLADQEAHYNEDGTLARTETLERPHRVFVKFWIGGKGDDFLVNWIRATLGKAPEGVFNPVTERYEIDKVAALNQTLGKSAWNTLTHRESDYQGQKNWDENLSFNWYKKPAPRIRVETE